MVIQRWQSVLLLIAVVMMGLFTFMSLGQVQMPDYTYDFTTLGFEIEGESTDGAMSGYALRTWALFALSLLGTLLPAIAIFCFKDLNLQKRLCLIETLVIVAVAVAGSIYGYTAFDGASVSWSSMVVAPLIALVAVIYAYVRIKSDQRLLRSADRLR